MKNIDKWIVSDLAPDFIYLKNINKNIDLPLQLKIICPYKIWKDNKKNTSLYPILNVSQFSIENIMTYQIGALYAFAPNEISHIKPHGALYNAAAKDIKIVEPIFNSIVNFNPELIHVVLANSVWEDFVKTKQVKFSREGFADRAYTDEGQLVNRNIPGAVLKNHDEILERVVDMALRGIVKSIEGKEINLEIDTICLHGDNKESVELAKKVRHELVTMGCEVKKMTDFIS